MKIYIIILLILNTLSVNAQIWEEPYLLDPNSETVQFGDNAIIMEEENQDDVLIAIINYTGNSQPDVVFYVPPNGNALTGIVTRKNEETSYWELVVTKRQDYESGLIRFDFGIILNSRLYIVSFHIQNIDDNNPQIIPAQAECRVQEDTFDVNCFYMVTDEDGNLEDVTWTINGAPEHNTFKFNVQDNRPIPSNQKEMTLGLSLKKKLDFNVASLHIIDLEVMDSSHTTKLKLVIEVIDIPNQPPVWSSIFQFQEFDEKTAQRFVVEAKDGDIMVDDYIVYSISFPEEDWGKYISIIRETGEIIVKPIDRDFEQREIYKFSVRACEETFTPDACIEQVAVFMVNDINDNIPTFTLDGNNILYIEETRISKIYTKITVSDIDLGENAKYALVLTGEGNEVAFSVAPTSGYQQTMVDLFIVEPAMLDYENDMWRQFSFQLEAVEFVPSFLLPKPVTFTIQLINRNDELPIFQTCNDFPESQLDVCIILVEETFPGNTYLVRMRALDADINGSVEHTLLGTYANSILKIDSKTGDIWTQNISRPFDYETVPDIIVQVQAKDSLPGDPIQNVVLAQLIIKLMDINDESPVLFIDKIGGPVNENCVDGYDIGTEIVATDKDSMANLVLYIDWDASEATKNGRKVTDTENFTPYKGCVELDIHEDTLTRQFVRASLKMKETVSNNTPDFEIFDTLQLRIVVVDEDQPNGYISNSAIIDVQIYITDINDNAPQFTDSINNELIVVHNAFSGMIIALITATDKDQSDQLTYSIEPRNTTESGLVRINAFTGEIIVDGNDGEYLDVNVDKLYYTVFVTDGYHIMAAEIEINVVKLPVYH